MFWGKQKGDGSNNLCGKRRIICSVCWCSIFSFEDKHKNVLKKFVSSYLLQSSLQSDYSNQSNSDFHSKVTSKQSNIMTFQPSSICYTLTDKISTKKLFLIHSYRGEWKTSKNWHEKQWLGRIFVARTNSLTLFLKFRGCNSKSLYYFMTKKYW